MGRGRLRLGEWGEDLAVNFLRRHNFEIIERNFHTVYGEIDIVAKFGGDYYFVEVKTRRDPALATDLAIGAKKRLFMERAMKKYCLRRQIGDTGLITAGIIVLPDRIKKTVKIRFVILRD